MSSVMEFKELALALWNKERHMTFEFKGRPAFSHYRDSLHGAYLCSGLGKKNKNLWFLKVEMSKYSILQAEKNNGKN